MSEPKVSVDEAIKRGQLRVNVPVMLTLGLSLVPVLLGASTPVMIITILVVFVAAWLVWSWSLPKWRLWAYEHVDNVESLVQKAVETNLMWPPGHILERAEIKSAEHKAREEAALERWMKETRSV